MGPARLRGLVFYPAGVGLLLWGERGVAAVPAVCCVRGGPCRLLCWGGTLCGGKHIIISVPAIPSPPSRGVRVSEEGGAERCKIKIRRDSLWKEERGTKGLQKKTGFEPAAGGGRSLFACCGPLSLSLVVAR